jgi:hypothetical protein
VAVACVPAFAASDDQSSLLNFAQSGVHAGIDLDLNLDSTPFHKSSAQSENSSFAFDSWMPQNEDDSEEALSVEAFTPPTQLISGLPLPLSSSIELHGSQSFRALAGHDDVSRLRGPPLPLFL